VSERVGEVELKALELHTLGRDNFVDKVGVGDLSRVTSHETAQTFMDIINPTHGGVIGFGGPGAVFNLCNDLYSTVVAAVMVVVTDGSGSRRKLGVTRLEVVKVEEVESLVEALATAHVVLMKTVLADMLVSVFFVIVVLYFNDMVKNPTLIMILSQTMDVGAGGGVVICFVAANNGGGNLVDGVTVEARSVSVV
jgi:hypothetical protein